MKLFRKNKPDNWIIKLTRITDKDSAEKFDMENCVLSTIDSITQYTDLKASYFDINFKSSRKTLNGFKKELKNKKEIVYSFVGFDSEKTNTYFIIDNPMLNWIEKPENSSIEICIQIASDRTGQAQIEMIADNLIENYNFNYGYITRLPWNYDSGTERKMHRRLFSTEVRVNEIDHAWTFHSIGVLYGYIKRIYQINYLNKSHLGNSMQNELFLKNGNIEKVTEDIYKWSLNFEQFELLKNNKFINEISIITPGLEFLKTDEAKFFKDKMKLKSGNSEN